MRILGARIFSKFFGGKILAIWKDDTYSAFKFFKRPQLFWRET